MNHTNTIHRALWIAAALIIGGSLMSCQKSEKMSTAGGSSTQSVMTFRGSTQ